MYMTCLKNREEKKKIKEKNEETKIYIVWMNEKTLDYNFFFLIIIHSSQVKCTNVDDDDSTVYLYPIGVMHGWHI